MPGLQPIRLTVQPEQWGELNAQLNYVIKDIYSLLDELKGVNNKSATIYTAPTYTDTSPTFEALTATRLMASDASKAVVSTDLSAWLAGTANQITATDDLDGTMTLSLPDPVVLPGALTLGGAVTGGGNNLAGIGTIGCGTITTTGDYLLTNGNYVGISANERLEFYTAGYAAFMGCSVGIGMSSAPLGKLHVMTSDAAGNAVSTYGDELVVENSTDAGITILSGDTYQSSLFFADSGAVNDGYIQYNHNIQLMAFTTAAGGGTVYIDSTGNFGIGTGTFGTSAAKVLGMANATAPTTSPGDMVQLYSFDRSAGYAQLHYRAEGGLARPWQQVFNVMDYGAYNDGTNAADTKDAIQVAINAAITAGGGIVFFPKGTYAIDEVLQVYTDNAPVILKGDGWANSIIISTISGALIRFDKSANTCYNSGMEDLYIDGTAKANTGNGVEFGNTTACYVNRCQFHNLDAGIVLGEGAGELTSKMTISDIQMNGCKYGIYIVDMIECIVQNFRNGLPGGATGTAAIYADTTSCGAGDSFDTLTILNFQSHLDFLYHIYLDLSSAGSCNQIGQWSGLMTENGNTRPIYVNANGTGGRLMISHSDIGEIEILNCAGLILIGNHFSSDTACIFTGSTYLNFIGNSGNGLGGEWKTAGNDVDFTSQLDEAELKLNPGTGSAYFVADGAAAVTDEAGLALTKAGVAKWSIYSRANSTDLRFYTSSDLFWFTAAGDVGIGITPTYRLDVLDAVQAGYAAKFRNNGDAADFNGIMIQAGKIDQSATVDNVYLEGFDNNGVSRGGLEVDNNAFQVWSASDKALKQNIVNTDMIGLDIIQAIQIRDFEWKTAPGLKRTGIIAQELADIYPSAVLRDSKGVARSALIYPIIKGMQELAIQFQQLDERLKLLEAA